MIAKYIEERDQYRFYPTVEGDTGILANLAAKHAWRRKADGSLTIPGYQIESVPTEVIRRSGLQPPTKKRIDPWNLLHLPSTVTPYPFQREDILYMVEPGGFAAWDDAGCGKTVKALGAYIILKRLGRVDGMLVIGPEAGRHVWCTSNDPAYPSKAEQFIGEGGHYVERKKPLPSSGIIYSTGDKIFREPYFSQINKLLSSKRWILCVDEAHMFSGYFSKRFNILDLWADWCLWRWPMSATSQSNYPDTTYPIYKLITRTDVSLEEWNQWFKKSDGGWKENRLAQYGRYQRRFSSTRRKRLPDGTPNPEIAPHLPPITSTVLRVPLEGRQEEMYDLLIREGRAAWGERKINAQDFWHKLIHLHSIASHPLVSGEPNYGTISKFKILEELLQSVGQQKVCIWSWHPSVLEWLCIELRERSVLYHGAVSKRDKEMAVHRFNNDPSVRYFLGNPSAAGMSLNLQAGSVRIFWDQHPEWHELHQARERIDRIDNYSGVPLTEYVLLGAGTVEEVTYESNERKQNLQRLVLGQNKEAVWTSPVVGNIFERWKNRK